MILDSAHQNCPRSAQEVILWCLMLAQLMEVYH